MGTVRGVQVSVCTWGNVSESRKWKCGVLPLKKLFSFCVQEWEKLEAVFFCCFYLFCIFFLIQITQFLVCYSYCPHTWCVHFWLLPKWGKHVWLLMSTTNIYWYRLNQLTAFYRRPHVRHILKGHLDHLTSQSCYTVGGQFHKGSTQLSHRYNSRYNTYYYHYPQSHLGSNRMHVTGLCHQDTKEGHFCGNVSEQMYN